jgi:hypothetical protein
MVRGDPTLEECLELLQARTGRGFVEISQTIALVEERHRAAKAYPSLQAFLEIQSFAQAEFQRWVDRAIADLGILLGAGNLDRQSVARMASLELREFAQKIKDATKAEAFRGIVNPQAIGAEQRKYAQLLTSKLRPFEAREPEPPRAKIEDPGIPSQISRNLARRRQNGSCAVAQPRVA